MEAELHRLVCRLKALSPSGLARRRDAIRMLLDTLADPRPVPDLPDHALPDAVAVVGRQAIDDAGDDPDKKAAVSAAVSVALTATK